MNSEYFQQGNEVKGIVRIFPTKTSMALVLTLISATPASFFAMFSHADKILPTWNPLEKTLISCIVSLGVFSVLSLVLFIDLLFIVHASKHREIVHYNNTHPHMSFKWLYQNAVLKHWLFLAAIFTVGVILGVLIYAYP